MKDYKDFANFLTYVKVNKLFYIKSELTAMIILLKGDFQKINDAIAFAKTNSDFDFEIHQPSQSNISLITAEDKFVYENGELLNNFSQERLNEVFRLYTLMCKEKGVNNESKREKAKDFKSINNTKKIIIVAGVTVAAYLLYEILK